jgi:hypothetical protein
MQKLLESISLKIEGVNKMVRTQAARTSLMLAKYDQILTDVIDMLDMDYDQQTIRDHINNAQAEIDNLSEM